MKLIAGSILTGFSLLAKVLEGFSGGTLGEWMVGMHVPTGIQVLIWFFMAFGVGLIIWGIMDTLHSREHS